MMDDDTNDDATNSFIMSINVHHNFNNNFKKKKGNLFIYY